MAATVTVWCAETDSAIEVTRAEAVAGLQRYARSLGPGTPACGEWERRAIELARTGAVEGFNAG